MLRPIELIELPSLQALKGLPRTPLKTIKTSLKRWLPLPVTYFKSWRLLFRPDSHLFTSGWFASQLQGYPCQADGSPIPWMNDAMVHFLEQRLHGDLTLFEYGSGYSTLFFGRRLKQVRAIEHVAAWQQIVQAQAPCNTTVQHQPLDYDGDYCRAIRQSGQRYDIVVVDGRDRNRCAMQAYEALSEGGVILFDDTQREKYQEGIQFLLQHGFKQLEFHGLKPVDHASGQTSVFYRPHNCLGL